MLESQRSRTRPKVSAPKPSAWLQRDCDGTPLQGLQTMRTRPWAMPKAGMGTGLWPWGGRGSTRAPINREPDARITTGPPSPRGSCSENPARSGQLGCAGTPLQCLQTMRTRPWAMPKAGMGTGLWPWGGAVPPALQLIANRLPVSQRARTHSKVQVPKTAVRGCNVAVMGRAAGDGRTHSPPQDCNYAE